MDLSVNPIGLPDYGKLPDPIDWSVVAKIVLVAVAIMILIHIFN